MPSPIDATIAFLDQWGVSREAMRQSVRDYFTAETVWENVGIATTTGPDEAIALLDGFEASAGVDRVVIEMRTIAAQGDSVLTERIDRIIDKSGKETGALPVMGVLEFRDGKVIAWRDYFDSAFFAPAAG